MRIEGTTQQLDEKPTLDRKRKNKIEIVVDRVTANPSERSRLAQSVETAFDAGAGTMLVARAVEGVDEADWPVEVHSRRLACASCVVPSIRTRA